LDGFFCLLGKPFRIADFLEVLDLALARSHAATIPANLGAGDVPI
jgi:hypothetical protein